jgi:hypothetical protein
MSKNDHFFTLTKDFVINGQEIKAKSPLIIRLFENETPENHTLLVNHKIARVGFGSPVWIGNIPIKDIQPYIKWIGKA